jgi:hypothetical protein
MKAASKTRNDRNVRLTALVKMPQLLPLWHRPDNIDLVFWGVNQVNASRSLRLGGPPVTGRLEYAIAWKRISEKGRP